MPRLVLVFLTLALAGCAKTLPIGALGVDEVRQSWERPQIDLSNERKPLTVDGKTYKRGLGTHGWSELLVELDGQADRFDALVGVDDEVMRRGEKGSVEFMAYVDGRLALRSGVVRSGEPARPFRVDLKNARDLALLVTDGGDGITADHADWLNATFRFRGKPPRAVAPPVETAVRLTPPVEAEPKFQGARVTGVRPGSPFLFKVAVSGEKPMRYEAADLPFGLLIDSATGVITGKLDQPGTHVVQLRASNFKGEATGELKIVCGPDALALTPPMGWNSWNCFGPSVTAGQVRVAANKLVESGLADFGWTYVNVDDCYQPKPGSTDPKLSGAARGPNGEPRTNAKFPDMAELVEHVHSLGLKAGIYSSPGPTTCAGHVGSYMFEAQDAKQWAAWGFDYVKYDLCSYGGLEQQLADALKVKRTDPLVVRPPYEKMRVELEKQPRDIVYSLCQYGNADVWTWGAAVGGHLWRTTGDIVDTWDSVSTIGFGQAGLEKHAGPGRWNDPDMLVVGKVGWGPALRPTRLTPSEQYAHVSLWSLLAAPLLIGCDLAQLDDFTLGLLANGEVIAVNQDALGAQAKRVKQDGLTEVWAKPLADGSVAVGLFNRGPRAALVTATLADLGLNGRYQVRDVWRQRDVTTVDASYAAQVERHGVMLVRLRRVR